MEPEVERRFQQIEATLAAWAKMGEEAERRAIRRHELAERRWAKFDQRMKLAEQRMDRAEQRMDRADQRMDRAEQRMDRADQRMDKFDKKLEATRKLVELGMKLMVRLEARLDDLAKTQRAFLRSLGNGRNGGRGPLRGR